MLTLYPMQSLQLYGERVNYSPYSVLGFEVLMEVLKTGKAAKK